MLVDRWSMDDDLLTWRLHVRDGARFHTGRLCDARAVADSFDLHSDPVASPVNQFFWKPVRDVTADGDEVAIHLHHPYAGLPTLLRSWHSAIHDQDERARLGDDYGWKGASGTGPFRFSRLQPGTSMDVQRWDPFGGSAVTWLQNRGAAWLDGIQWVPLLDEESTSRGARGRRGRLHPEPIAPACRSAGSAPRPARDRVPAVLARLPGAGSGDARSSASTTSASAVPSRAPSIRALLVQQDLGGHGWVADGPIPSHSPWYDPIVETWRATIQRLPRSSSTRPGFQGCSRHRMTVPVIVLQDATIHRVARTLQHMLGAIGIRLELEHIAGFQEFYAAPGAASARLHLEVALAGPGRRDRRVHRFALPPWPELAARRPIRRIDAACDGWRTAPDEDSPARGSRTDPACLCRTSAADPALLSGRRVGASPARPRLAPDGGTISTRSTTTSGSTDTPPSDDALRPPSDRLHGRDHGDRVDRRVRRAPDHPGRPDELRHRRPSQSP